MIGEEITNIFGSPIFAYTRAQAIADGVLIDVTKVAEKTGFKIPVAVTDSVWRNYIEWSQEDSNQQSYQDTNGRLWDVLFMLHVAITKNKDTDLIFYKLHVIPRDGKTKTPKLIQLKSMVSAGDNGEPVITIM